MFRVWATDDLIGERDKSRALQDEMEATLQDIQNMYYFFLSFIPAPLTLLWEEFATGGGGFFAKNCFYVYVRAREAKIAVLLYGVNM